VPAAIPIPSHPISWALGILALVHKRRGDAPSTKRAAAEAVEVAGQHNLPQWRGFAELWLGWALGRLGEREEGLALLQVAQRRLRDTGAVLFTVMSNWVLASTAACDPMYGPVVLQPGGKRKLVGGPTCQH
jgi:hypothetical protein